MSLPIQNTHLRRGKTGEQNVSEPRPRIVLVGVVESALDKLAQQLKIAGFPTQVAKDLSTMKFVEPVPQIAIFLAQTPQELRNRVLGVLGKSNPALKVVMLYENAISGTERADAVINARCEIEDLVRTLKYVAG
jgi:hypothetical protein